MLEIQGNFLRANSLSSSSPDICKMQQQQKSYVYAIKKRIFITNFNNHARFLHYYNTKKGF